MEPPAGLGVPTLGQVGSGWDRHAAGGLRVDGLASGRVAAVAAAAVRRLLATDVGAGAPHTPDGRSPRPSGPYWPPPWPSRDSPGAPRSSPRCVRLGNPAPWPIWPAGRGRASQSASVGERPLSRPMTASAGPTGGWASGRGGDDPVYRGVYLLALRDLLVTERHGNLDLLAGIGAAADFAPSARPSRCTVSAPSGGSSRSDSAGTGRLRHCSGRSSLRAAGSSPGPPFSQVPAPAAKPSRPRHRPCGSPPPHSRPPGAARTRRRRRCSAPEGGRGASPCTTRPAPARGRGAQSLRPTGASPLCTRPGVTDASACGAYSRPMVRGLPAVAGRCAPERAG